MQNNFGLKLIAVMDINSLKLYKAQGLKIISEIGNFSILSSTNHKTGKHEGFNEKKSTQPSFYDPHTSPKDIEYQESSKTAIDHINRAFADNSSFKELCVVANAKMLGHFRQSLSSNLKKVLSKEVQKDLINHTVEDIEKALFA